MAKITRVTQKIFASGAGANQIIEYGSFANGGTVYSSDPTVIQSLGNWLTGWFGAVVGENAPTIEDMNAVHFVYAYQLAYIMQTGIPEWDAGTTYFIGSFASVAGKIYVSLTNNNLNNAVTDTNNWRGNLVVNLTSFTGDGTYVVPAGVTSVKITAIRRWGLKNVLSADDNAVIAMDNFGNTYAWGYNVNGNLGVGNVTPRSSPVAVLGGLTFTQIVQPNGAGFYSSYGLTPLGAAYGWGLNDHGQLGVGDVTPRSSPVAILGGLVFGSLFSTGGGSAFGLTPGGTLYAWGSNTTGELGVGDVTPRSSPVAVLEGLVFSTVITENSATGVIALDRTGKAYGWGINDGGQLGVGDVASRSSPVAVLGGLTFQKVLMGRESAYGLTHDGVLYGWGLAAGNGAGAHSSPVAVLGGLTFADFFESGGSVFGITSDGTAYAWGLNDAGQLGVGDTTNRASPVLVLGSQKWQAFAGPGFSAGAYYVLGLSTTGAAYGMGSNGEGQLGNGDRVDRSSPVAVVESLTFLKIATAIGPSPLSFGITTGGALYAWGDNANGGLGVGDVAGRSSPVAVLGTLFPKIGQEYSSVTIPVTPGASYAVNLQRFIPLFGNTPVANWPVSSIQVEYDQ